jgi:anti-sigma regulatory factor (Ser/Thr protein kinase)
VNDWRRITHTQSLDASSLSARRARDVLRGVCADARVPTPLIETALLLVSEVVTNAVVHGSGRPVLDIAVLPAVLRVTVTDDAPAAGPGLQLVATLAARWGTDHRLPHGRSVWFELDQR